MPKPTKVGFSGFVSRLFFVFFRTRCGVFVNYWTKMTTFPPLFIRLYTLLLQHLTAAAGTGDVGMFFMIEWIKGRK